MKIELGNVVIAYSDWIERKTERFELLDIREEATQYSYVLKYLDRKSSALHVVPVDYIVEVIECSVQVMRLKERLEELSTGIISQLNDMCKVNDFRINKPKDMFHSDTIKDVYVIYNETHNKLYPECGGLGFSLSFMEEVIEYFTIINRLNKIERILEEGK